MYNTPPLSIIHQNTYRIPSSEINPASHAPIGIFDSGVGGLSVAIEIARHLPNEKIIYFADTAHVPYGAKSDQEIRDLTARAIAWLYDQGCKLAVVACNSASAFSLDYLRQFYGERLPIIGLVPALKPAVLQSKSKVVAVLATPATFRGKLIQNVMENFAQPADVKVLPITCLDLVPYVEQGLQMSDICLNTLKNILNPALEQGADHLVLGCTHYPFLRPAIEFLFAERLNLIDSGQAVARQTARILLQAHLNQSNPLAESTSRLKIYSSGKNLQQLQGIIKQLLPNDIDWQLDYVVNI